MTRVERDRRWQLVLAATSIAALLAGVVSPPASAGPYDWKNCENDSPLCNAYELMPWDDCWIAYGQVPCRWPTEANGKVRVDFLLNPEGMAFNLLSVDDLVGAVENAMRAWEEANPNLDLRLLGLTDAPPSTVVGHPIGHVHGAVQDVVPSGHLQGAAWFDGVNVIGWLPTSPSEAALQAAAQMGGLPGVETDIALYGDYGHYTWDPCYRWCPDVLRLATDPYWPVTETTSLRATYKSGLDIQMVLTHELGHALGLHHPVATNNCGLTMSGCLLSYVDHETRENTDHDPDDVTMAWRTRGASTIGLGDIRGLQVLYPWACPKPATHEFRYLCPERDIAIP